ncbi:MAG: hypothetical protein K2I80_10380 [Ruminococcus sp.]|nr:hypothetical protein [Ruminococcus sp.]MDE6848413.1 hypothetical protein [Ruminococcus sp.]
MNDFMSLRDDKKTAFLLELSMKTVSLLHKVKHKTIAEKTIEYCRKWLYNGSPDGDFLYELLINEQDGITIFAENTEDISEQAAWNCIIDAVPFTSRKTYESENVKWYPEPIELVSDELIYHFMECYHFCFSDDKYIKNITEYLNSSENKSEWKNYFEK